MWLVPNKYYNIYNKYLTSIIYVYMINANQIVRYTEVQLVVR